MKILLACEESQAVTKEFRKLGHEAYSCDLLPCSGGHPEWHIQQNIIDVMNGWFDMNEVTINDNFDLKFDVYSDQEEYIYDDYLIKQIGWRWDMIIAFPPCTFLTVTGNRWFNIDRYGDKAIQRHRDRKEAISFFMMFANADCEKIAIENPIGVISSIWRKPNQIINPYEFGDPFEKKTCLWLKGLPPLKPTNIVTPPKRTEFKSGKTMPSWYAEAWKLPKEERAKLRSKTFPGIAKAMAEQWGTEDNLFIQTELFNQ